MTEPLPFIPIWTREPFGAHVNGSPDSAYGSQPDEAGAIGLTHDIRRTNYHVKNLSSFVDALQESNNRAFPNRGRSSQRYTKVQCLLLFWTDDDLWVESELRELEKCFRQHYNFETEVFAIPSKNPHRKLMSKVCDMIENYESEDTLFIVYYGGHARIDDSRQSTWCATRRPDSPTLQWSAIQTLLERSPSDTLILLDCCAGAASATFANGESVTETISASAWDAIAPEPGRFSFTSCLIRVLSQWSNHPFSAVQLHAEMLARLKHPRPRMDRGRVCETRSTPVHFMMTSNHRAPSIEIKRLDPSSLSPPLLDQGALEDDQPPYDGAMELLRDPDEDNPHVMVTLSLEDDQQLDLNAWEQWLGSFPAFAKHVKVQGVFKSHSTLLLLSLPVMVWDMLPDDPACSFIAFIRSNNLILSKQSERETAEVSVPSEPAVAETSDQLDRETGNNWMAVNQPEAPPTTIDVHHNASDFDNKQDSALPEVQDNDAQSSQLSRHEASEANMNASRDRDGSPKPPYRDNAPRSRIHDRTTLVDAPHAFLGEPDLDDDGVSVLSAPTYREVDISPPARPGIMSSPLSWATEGDEILSRPNLYGSEPSLGSRAQQQTRQSASALGRPVQSQRQSMDDNNASPEGPKLAKHVVQRLEEYFHGSPHPDSSVTAFFASSLGIETRDVDSWFHSRRLHEKLESNFQNLRITDPSSGGLQPGTPLMILPGDLNQLLTIFPHGQVMFVDLRPPAAFEKTHIHSAINLRCPVSYIKYASLDMIQDTILDPNSQQTFAKWQQARCMVFYDRVIGFPWECPVAFALYDKLTRQGWTGQAFILKGNFIEFSASFEEYISGRKMTEKGKAYKDSVSEHKPTEEDLQAADEKYAAYLHSLETQARVATTELIPSRKAERIRAVEKHQQELELEMEKALPALWRKVKALGPPSPSPAYSESSASPAKDKDKFDNFDTKAPLVEPLVRGVAKMQEAAAESGHSISGQSLPSTPLPRYHKMASTGDGDKGGDDKSGGGTRLSTEEYVDFQTDEALRNDPEFMQAAAVAGSGAGTGVGQEHTGKVGKGVVQRGPGILGFRFGRKTISK